MIMSDEDFKKAVYSRSEKRIEQRRIKRKKIMSAGVSVMLVLALVPCIFLIAGNSRLKDMDYDFDGQSDKTDMPAPETDVNDTDTDGYDYGSENESPDEQGDSGTMPDSGLTNDGENDGSTLKPPENIAQGVSIQEIKVVLKDALTSLGDFAVTAYKIFGI